MKTITFYVVAALCLLATKLTAQETFEDRVIAISKNIEKITKEEKDSLKIEVERVNEMLENNEISTTDADSRKKQFADQRAKNIEDRIAAEEEKLSQLVKDKVDGKISGERKFRITFGDKKKDTVKTKDWDFRRTTSQLVVAFGVNRLVTDGEIDGDNYKWRSDFYEWGVAWNTRIFKHNNLLHAKYGLSLQYNNLRPNHDKIFVTNDNGETVLMDSGLDLKVSRLRYVNLVIPAHLEFDLTPRRVNGDKTYYPIHRSVRLGLGGYVGANVKEKQIIKYNNDHKVKHKEKGDFNVSDFVYGLSAYVGYSDVTLYAKYDLQPVFANNPVDQNNLSLGIRFDFN